MIRQYLSNKNESVTVLKPKKFHELNKTRGRFLIMIPFLWKVIVLGFTIIILKFEKKNIITIYLFWSIPL